MTSSVAALVGSSAVLNDTTSGYTGANEFALVSADSNCPTPPSGLAPQATCHLAIGLTADASNLGKSITGTLTITNNTAGSPQVVNLTAAGVPPVTPDGDCYLAGDGSCNTSQANPGYSGQSCLIDALIAATRTTVGILNGTHAAVWRDVLERRLLAFLDAEQRG